MEYGTESEVTPVPSQGPTVPAEEAL